MEEIVRSYVVKKRKRERVIGLDVGVKTLVVLSNGIEIPQHPSLPKLRARLQKHIDKAERQEFFSNRWFETQRLINKTEEKIRNAQKDHAEKIADFLTKHWKIIAIERTQMGPQILTNPDYNRAVQEANWPLLIATIKRKARERKCKVVEVQPFYTSQDCSGCGYRQKLPLHQRTYDCPKCGLSLDRDVNAAINVRNRGIKKLSKEKPIPFPPF